MLFPGLESTYKELKHFLKNIPQLTSKCLESTYKELKHEVYVCRNKDIVNV